MTLFGSQQKVMQCGERLALFKDEEDEKLKCAEAERQKIKDEEYKQREAEVERRT